MVRLDFMQVVQKKGNWLLIHKVNLEQWLVNQAMKYIFKYILGIKLTIFYNNIHVIILYGQIRIQKISLRYRNKSEQKYKQIDCLLRSK